MNDDFEPPIEFEEVTYLQSDARYELTSDAFPQIILASSPAMQAASNGPTPLRTKGKVWALAAALGIGGFTTALIHENAVSEREESRAQAAREAATLQIYDEVERLEGYQAALVAAQPAFLDFCKATAQSQIDEDKDIMDAGCADAVKGRLASAADIKAAVGIAAIKSDQNVYSAVATKLASSLNRALNNPAEQPL